MSEQINTLAVMVRDATDAEKFRIGNQHAFGHDVRVSYRSESDQALAAVAELIGALREARRWIGDGDMSDGMHRSIWTPAYAAVVDQVDVALARAQGVTV